MKSVILLVFTICAFACITGCKKDSSPTSNATALVGTWQNKDAAAGAATGVSSVYVFNANGSYEERAVAYNVSNNLTVGFIYKTTGKYAFNNNELTFSDRTFYNKSDYQVAYVPQDQLVPQKSDLVSKYNVGFSAKRDSLSMIVQCPANAFCVGLQWYKRQ